MFDDFEVVGMIVLFYALLEFGKFVGAVSLIFSRIFILEAWSHTVRKVRQNDHDSFSLDSHCSSM